MPEKIALKKPLITCYYGTLYCWPYVKVSIVGFYVAKLLPPVSQTLLWICLWLLFILVCMILND